MSRAVALAQLACVGVGTAILILLWQHNHSRELVALFVCAAVGGLVTIYGLRAAGAERQAAEELARTMVAERELKTTLEQMVVTRSSELEDAQRVLQRMWWLGQQITLELNPQRVLERFLEAVTDIVQGDGAAIGLIGESDGKIRIVRRHGHRRAARGNERAGHGLGDGACDSRRRGARHRERPRRSVALRPGHLRAREGYVRRVGDRPDFAAWRKNRRRLRRHEDRAREFTSADLERIEAMSDLLSVSLENAELVETLRQTEWRFRTLFRAAPDAVFTVVESGRIREANDAVREVTGRRTPAAHRADDRRPGD